MRHVILLLVCLGLFSFSADTTGPSYCTYSIDPVAWNDEGDILCRTFIETNESGGHYQPAQKYGWLLLNRDGKWEEFVHSDVPNEFADVSYDIYDTIQKLETWYKTPLDFKNPPSSLDSVLELGFMYSFWEDMNANQFYWKNGEIQNTRDSVLMVSTHQKSIAGLSTINFEGTRVPCKAYLKGLAFFENKSGWEDEQLISPLGGHFFEVDYDNGIYGYEIYNVTGVVIVK